MVKLYDSDTNNLKQIKDLQVCRDIVKKISEFGVSQPQMIHIIYLLAIELENNDLMKRLCSVLSEDKLLVNPSNTSDALIITNTEE